MRTAFNNALANAARKNKNVFLLTADVGYSVLEPFRDEFPERFYNMGVAEANTIGTAAGLALCGKKPFAFSMACFISMRGFEHVRDDISCQNLDVKLVGVGQGFHYSLFGPSHWALEDVALMRCLPNFTVLCPGDPVEVELAVNAIVESKGPTYLRLGGKGEPVIHKEKPAFKIGKAIQVKEGKDVTLIATGNMLANSFKATEILAEKKVNAGLLSMHSVKPIDSESILKAVSETNALFTVEEHNIIGGLGSAVAEVLAENNCNVKFKRIGVQDLFPEHIGGWNFIKQLCGLTPEKIAETVLEAIKK